MFKLRAAGSTAIKAYNIIYLYIRVYIDISVFSDQYLYKSILNAVIKVLNRSSE